MPYAPMIYLLAADLVLFLHVLVVVFIVGGLALVYVGFFLAWPWVRNPWFRLAHLLAMGVVTLQAWLGQLCPLTHLENALRAAGGEAVYPGAFIARLLESALYYRAPPWVFILCYTAFAALILASWIWIRPRPFSGRVRAQAEAKQKD